MNFKFNKPDREVTKVYLHHSASNKPEHDDISVIREWHIQRGFNDVGYHFFITSDGNIQRGRSLELIPAAQQGFNTGSIAICVSGTSGDLTKPQIKSLQELCGQINKAYSGEISFHGHKEVMPTECPAYDYRKILSLDQSGKIVTNLLCRWYRNKFVHNQSSADRTTG